MRLLCLSLPYFFCFVFVGFVVVWKLVPNVIKPRGLVPQWLWMSSVYLEAVAEKWVGGWRRQGQRRAWAAYWPCAPFLERRKYIHTVLAICKCRISSCGGRSWGVQLARWAGGWMLPHQCRHFFPSPWLATAHQHPTSQGFVLGSCASEKLGWIWVESC